MSAATLSSAQAQENINIYGWQNWSYEFIDVDRPGGADGRSYDRLRANAANIGFKAHMDTGLPGLQVGFRCEQFTFWGNLNNYTGWCNRNSKISLRHERAGEIMFGQWLLPYNQIVAQWVDPFQDAGALSHTSIMGNIGAYDTAPIGHLSALFYNGSFDSADDFTSDYGSMSFNRRQEGIIQYVWPNTDAVSSQSRDGFQFRFAMTEGSNTDAERPGKGSVDPRIYSTGAAYQSALANGDQVWFAVAYERHEDIALTEAGGQAGQDPNNTVDPHYTRDCGASDSDGYRLAARYVRNWDGGQATTLAGMFEKLDFIVEDCLDADGVGLGRDENGDWAHIGALDSVGSDRTSWMVSGKHIFGNGFDVRFSYMDAGELDCDAGTCTNEQEDTTDAEAYNFGVFYTMPKGTELRATYSEVRNDEGSQYDFGISPATNDDGVAGEDISMFAVGIVHWFD